MDNFTAILCNDGYKIYKGDISALQVPEGYKKVTPQAAHRDTVKREIRTLVQREQGGKLYFQYYWKEKKNSEWKLLFELPV